MPMPASLPPHRLQIELDPHEAAVVLRLEGELDAATAEQFERFLTGMPEPGPLLVLDLHELSFVDSLGLNKLFRAREWATAHGIALRVVRAPVHVQRLLALAALDGSLGPFYPDASAALRA
jgi:anti-anti-sigma factor